MKRLIAFITLLPLAGCSANIPRSEELRYISELERKVALPEGGGDLKCYRRDYALTASGEELLGFYIRADGYPEFRVPPARAGVYLHPPGYKIGVTDQGCDVLFIRYKLSNPDTRPRAICFPDVSGGSPHRVVPSVVC